MNIYHDEAHLCISWKEAYPKHSQQNEGDELNEIPWIVVINVEHDQVVIAKGVE